MLTFNPLLVKVTFDDYLAHCRQFIGPCEETFDPFDIDKFTQITKHPRIAFSGFRSVFVGEEYEGGRWVLSVRDTNVSRRRNYFIPDDAAPGLAGSPRIFCQNCEKEWHLMHFEIPKWPTYTTALDWYIREFLEQPRLDHLTYDAVQRMIVTRNGIEFASGIGTIDRFVHEFRRGVCPVCLEPNLYAEFS